MLIALAATVVLAALWLVALRPKDDAASDSAPIPPQIEAIDKAKDAAAAADASTAATEAAAASASGESAPAATPSAPAVTPATPVKPQSKAAVAATEKRVARAAQREKLAKIAATSDSGAEKRVLRDLGNNKIVVLLFAGRRAADDRAVTRAIRGLDRHEGRVKVHRASINDVGAFETITRGVTITQSPTVVVIDRRLKARSIVGFAPRREISQAVGDALNSR